ncbi:unnamed protein product [Fraxinus pennsylvanica]|uniref:Uncharacterized protein n=1 Tax=Fraxinus pennsylvanica TaxID=56036 RepID=A0AAD1ZC51_9LAMI|nr:unnamed protein product [Fraxinus pennsylvanica]
MDGETNVVGESSRSSQLKSDARPFRYPYPSPDERMLFATFSNGHPVSREEIYDYFSVLYGSCLQKVYVHENNEFAKILFTTMSLPASIMGDQEVVHISINNKPVWLKKFRRPDSNRNQTQ